MEEDGISVTVDGSLVISYAERKHHGKYTCTATNEVGSVEATCQVVVEGKNIIFTISISKLFECKNVNIFLSISLSICFGCSKEPSQ